jgi:hypothetical protein
MEELFDEIQTFLNEQRQASDEAKEYEKQLDAYNLLPSSAGTF